MFNKTNLNRLLTDINVNFSYNKIYIFPEENNNYNLNKKYANVNISLTYLDYISSQTFEEIKSIINENNTNSLGKTSSIYIKLKEEKIETINLLGDIQPVFVCPKCNRSYTFDQNSFYFCSQCQENKYYCEECYRGFFDIVKIKKNKKEKNSEKNVFHEHPLLFFYKYNKNKSSFIIKEKYNKYRDILGNNKRKRICKVNCSICFITKNLVNSNIIISHLKKKKIENLNINENMEICICDKCFKLKNFTNTILGEKTENNIIIL